MVIASVFAAPGSIGQSGGTAYFAHLGGFVAGLVLTLFRKKGNALMQTTKKFNTVNDTHRCRCALYGMILLTNTVTQEAITTGGTAGQENRIGQRAQDPSIDL